jgi:tetraacyldisaccharide 4'-kinase
VPDGDTQWLQEQRVVAWAGIGAPQRFFAMLETLGASLVERIAFADHQSLGAHDAERLLGLARQHGATLVSTEKDLARLRGSSGASAELAGATRTLKIKLTFGEADAERLNSLVESALKRPRS